MRRSRQIFPPPESSLGLGVFGNCQVSALIDEPGRMVWARLGLMSEDYDVRNGEQWGSFPWTCSLVYIILGAIRLSKPWEVVY